MRDAYHGELLRLSSELHALCQLAEDAMARAAHALVCKDLLQAEHVITSDVDIDRAYAQFERAACSVLALQAPVASELRSIVSMIQVGENLMRMGDLACHIAESARRRHPESAVPAPLVDRCAEMGQIGVCIAGKVGLEIERPDGTSIAELEKLDDRVDELEAEILAWVGTEAVDVRTGVDVALLARFFERYADQGVAAARRLQFAATGERSRVDHH
jgi:phosphate transport system protein